MQRTRPIPLFLTALVALFGALAALAATNGHDAHAHDGGAGAATLTRREHELRQDMRKLWEDHVTWTRLAVISLSSDSPDTDATVGRLLRNQADIGDAVRPFYGDGAADALTAELRRHILIAADVIAAARAGDAAGLAGAQARWEANAEAIATLLASANPHWPLARLRHELRTHLELTTDEVVARLGRDWAADVAAYDRIHDHALHFADQLSTGLLRQFPERFGR